MKALLILLLPAMMLIGCGQMQTNDGTAGELLSQMNASGNIVEEDLNNLNEDLMNESVEVSQTRPNSLMMKVGGAELLIDFIENLSGDNPEQTAMIINGIQVSQQLASDPKAFQGLIASLVTAQLEDVNILGIPASQLVQLGLGIVNGDADKKDLSQLFGTLVRGALNMFISKTPFSSLFGSILGPIVDQIDGGQSPQQPPLNNGSNTNNNNNNNSGNPLQSIIGTIGGAISGSNPLLGGFLSLIMNLIK